MMCLSCTSFSWFDTSGKVVSIITYAHTETILVNLDNSGTNVTECSSSATFSISKSMTPETRTRMYSMLLAAQASDRTVVISYNETGGCESWYATASAYRSITRLR